MSTQPSPKRLVYRWTSLKGMIAIIVFLIIASLIEFFIVLYAFNLGVEETPETRLQWDLQFPGTDKPTPIIVSLLFHLVPLSVVTTLLFSWSYMTKYVAVKRPERAIGRSKRIRREKRLGSTGKRSLTSKVSHTLENFFVRIKSALLKFKEVTYLWQKIHFTRATIKSALTVFLVFSAFILLISFIAYPQLIYRTISHVYQNNPSLLNSVKSTSNSLKGVGEVLAPIGWICSYVNDVLFSVAPGFRSIITGLQGFVRPMTDLDNIGKYLVFQNIAAWATALTALFYGEYMRRNYHFWSHKRS